jgi:hypothetical protein
MYRQAPDVTLRPIDEIESLMYNSLYRNGLFSLKYGLEELIEKLKVPGMWVQGNYEQTDATGLVKAACLVGWTRIIDTDAEDWIRRFIYLEIPDRFKLSTNQEAYLGEWKENGKFAQLPTTISMDALECELRGVRGRMGDESEGFNYPTDQAIINYNDEQGRTVEEVISVVEAALARTNKVGQDRFGQWGADDKYFQTIYDEWRATQPKFVMPVRVKDDELAIS